MKMRILIVGGLALSLGACATAIRGTTEQVAFQSEPPGAEIYTSTGLGCPATPCTITMPRKDPFVATFSKPGYTPEQVTVSTKVNGGGAAGLVGNALVGGVIGVAVDASNGATLDHDPNPVMAELKPLGRAGARGKRVRRAPARSRQPAQPGT